MFLPMELVQLITLFLIIVVAACLYGVFLFLTDELVALAQTHSNRWYMRVQLIFGFANQWVAFGQQVQFIARLA